jgi:hypothetical protein
LYAIKANLEKIATKLRRVVPGIHVTSPTHILGDYKLLCNLKGFKLKLK